MTPSPPAGSTASRLGAACWAVTAPAFLTANVIIGLAWKNSRYSWATNNISDLGNIHCGTWDTNRPRYVCSPWHSAMNVSFLLTGVLLVLGLLLTLRRVGSGITVRSAQVLLLASALGWGMAGVFPADTHENLHFFAGLLLFGLGNIGLVVAGLTIAPATTSLARIRVFSLSLGLLALAGMILFFARQGLGLGVGGMERVAAFPQLIWFAVVGVLLLRNSGNQAMVPSARIASEARR